MASEIERDSREGPAKRRPADNVSSSSAVVVDGPIDRTILPSYAYLTTPATAYELRHIDQAFVEDKATYCFEPVCQPPQDPSPSVGETSSLLPQTNTQASTSRLPAPSTESSPTSDSDLALQYSLAGSLASDGEESLLPRVDCAQLMNELERLMQQHSPTDSSFLEMYEGGYGNRKIKAYYALEFCLQATRILSDDGKNCIALYLTKKNRVEGELAANIDEHGKDAGDGDLVDVDACRRFVSRIRDLLKHSVQQRFITGCAADSRRKLKLYYDCSSFLTGVEDFKARSVYMPGTVEKHPSTSAQFYLYRLSPLIADKTEKKDFWLFASQITGVADLMERAELLVPAKIPEEFLLLEKPIALEFNRFALALVVEGGVKASMKSPADRLYKVRCDPEYITDKKSLEPLPKSPFRKPGIHPPSPELLELHHQIYRLLHESQAGRAWMKESDWNKIDTSYPTAVSSDDIYREALKKGAKQDVLVAEVIGEIGGGRIRQLADVAFNEEEAAKRGAENCGYEDVRSGEKLARRDKKIAEALLDREYTLVKAWGKVVRGVKTG